MSPESAWSRSGSQGTRTYAVRYRTSSVLYDNEAEYQTCRVNWKIFARGAAAMITGYVVIVGLTSIGFNGVFGGRALYGGSVLLLAAATLLAVVAGLVGGYLAGWIGPGLGRIGAALVLLPLAVDTIFVLFFWHGTSPFWFDAMGSITLMACTMAGGLLREKVEKRVSVA